MTSYTTEFTKEDFLALPEYDTKTTAPKDKTPFLLKSPGKLLKQKEYLLDALEALSKQNAEALQESSTTKDTIKLTYYIRHADGNLSERGGYIRLDTVIQDLLRGVALKVGDTDANGTLTIETGK